MAKLHRALEAAAAAQGPEFQIRLHGLSGTWPDGIYENFSCGPTLEDLSVLAGKRNAFVALSIRPPEGDSIEIRIKESAGGFDVVVEAPTAEQVRLVYFAFEQTLGLSPVTTDEKGRLAGAQGTSAQDEEAAIQAAFEVIGERLEALEKIAQLDRQPALGRAIAPLETWEITSCERLAAAGLPMQANMLPHLGYMGRGDPVLDITARIHAADRYLEDLRLQLEADPSILLVQLKRQKQERERRMASNPRRVAVVHGRNHHAKDGMFAFLSALGLDPVDWDAAIKETQEGSPHPGQTLDALFKTTQAVVVLLTPDETASLIEPLQRDARDRQVRRQARPNVWIEAGMALGVKPERTIFVRFGDHEEPSDIDGRDYIAFDGGQQGRSRLRDRLESVKCAVSARSDWLAAGQPHFAAAVIATQSAGKPQAGSAIEGLPNELVWDRLRKDDQRALTLLDAGDGRARLLRKGGVVGAFSDHEDPFEGDVGVMSQPGSEHHQNLMRLAFRELETLGLVVRKRDYPMSGEHSWELTARGRELMAWHHRERSTPQISYIVRG